MKFCKIRCSVFIGLLLIATTLLLTKSYADCGNDEPYDIAFIDIDPELLMPEENMTIRIQFTNNTFINSTKLFIYQSYPEFDTLAENIIMVGGHTSIRCQGTERFDANYTIDVDSGTKIIFKIQIIYDNLSSIFVPDKPNFLDMEIELVGCFGPYHFIAGTVGESVSKTTASIIIPSLLVVCSTIVYFKKRIN